MRTLSREGYEFASHIKIGKLTTVSQQTNANYQIPKKADLSVEHGFVENFCELFELKEKLKSFRREIEEKEYTASYPSMTGNIVFNSSVCWKFVFFEELFKPVVDNLNESDRIRGSKFMSLKAQINSLLRIGDEQRLFDFHQYYIVQRSHFQVHQSISFSEHDCCFDKSRDSSI